MKLFSFENNFWMKHFNIAFSHCPGDGFTKKMK